MRTAVAALPVAALLAALTPLAASAENLLGPSPALYPTTCAEFSKMSWQQQIDAVIATPIGNVMGPQDPAATEGFVRSVEKACAAAPDARLADVAGDVFGGN
jgi:hypothetical protein